MRLAEDIILRPYITEKSNIAIAEGKYTFVVDKKATKTEIKLAVEKLFGVKVTGVNTQNCEGKVKRQGVHVGRRADWKKAIVSVAQDTTVDKFLAEGGKETATGRKYKTSIEEFGAAN